VTPDRVLVVNAGSSSLKLSLLGSADQILASAVSDTGDDACLVAVRIR